MSRYKTILSTILVNLTAVVVFTAVSRGIVYLYNKLHKKTLPPFEEIDSKRIDSPHGDVKRVLKGEYSSLIKESNDKQTSKFMDLFTWIGLFLVVFRALFEKVSLPNNIKEFSSLWGVFIHLAKYFGIYFESDVKDKPDPITGVCQCYNGPVTHRYEAVQPIASFTKSVKFVSGGKIGGNVPDEPLTTDTTTTVMQPVQVFTDFTCRHCGLSSQQECSIYQNQCLNCTRPFGQHRCFGTRFTNGCPHMRNGSVKMEIQDPVNLDPFSLTVTVNSLWLKFKDKISSVTSFGSQTYKKFIDAIKDSKIKKFFQEYFIQIIIAMIVTSLVILIFFSYSNWEKIKQFLGAYGFNFEGKGGRSKFPKKDWKPTEQTKKSKGKHFKKNRTPFTKKGQVTFRVYKNNTRDFYDYDLNYLLQYFEDHFHEYGQTNTEDKWWDFVEKCGYSQDEFLDIYETAQWDEEKKGFDVDVYDWRYQDFDEDEIDDIREQRRLEKLQKATDMYNPDYDKYWHMNRVDTKDDFVYQEFVYTERFDKVDPRMVEDYCNYLGKKPYQLTDYQIEYIKDYNDTCGPNHDFYDYIGDDNRLHYTKEIDFRPNYGNRKYGSLKNEGGLQSHEVPRNLILDPNGQTIEHSMCNPGDYPERMVARNDILNAQKASKSVPPIFDIVPDPNRTFKRVSNAPQSEIKNRQKVPVIIYDNFDDYAMDAGNMGNWVGVPDHSFDVKTVDTGEILSYRVVGQYFCIGDNPTVFKNEGKKSVPTDLEIGQFYLRKNLDFHFEAKASNLSNKSVEDVRLSQMQKTLDDYKAQIDQMTRSQAGFIAEMQCASNNYKMLLEAEIKTREQKDEQIRLLTKVNEDMSLKTQKVKKDTQKIKESVSEKEHDIIYCVNDDCEKVIGAKVWLEKTLGRELPGDLEAIICPNCVKANSGRTVPHAYQYLKKNNKQPLWLSFTCCDCKCWLGKASIVKRRCDGDYFKKNINADMRCADCLPKFLEKQPKPEKGKKAESKQTKGQPFVESSFSTSTTSTTTTQTTTLTSFTSEANHFAATLIPYGAYTEEQPFFKDGAEYGWWTLGDIDGKTAVVFNKHFVEKQGVHELRFNFDPNYSLNIQNYKVEEHPYVDFACITDQKLVALLRNEAANIIQRDRLAGKVDTQGLKTAKLCHKEVPVGQQVWLTVVRQDKVFASPAICRKVNGEFAVQNNSDFGDCGRLYRREGLNYGMHTGSYGKNTHNVFLAFADVVAWFKALNF